MRSRLRPELYRIALLAIVVAAAVLTIRSTHNPREPVRANPSTTWRGLLGGAERTVSLGSRMIVVLRTPSVAQRLAGGRLVSEQDERGWTAQDYAAQQQVLTQLARHGLGVRPDYSFTRVLDGFSAALEPSAVALLERNPEVSGVYPVRAAYPATISSTALSGAEAVVGTGVQLGKLDGKGVSIALLDTGVDSAQPYIAGRIGPGFDVVGGSQSTLPGREKKPPHAIERHGTELAGLLVGSGGPDGIHGAAPGATVLPIRVAGWQSDGHGHAVVYARSDQVIAGLDRAVDPNQDGDTHDAARIALLGVTEPFASFADSPEAQAVEGALDLDMLVVVPAGNEGAAGPWFGSISGPSGSPGSLTVGATDPRPTTATVRGVLHHGVDVLQQARFPVIGSVAPNAPVDLLVGGPGRKSRLTGLAALLPAGRDPVAAAAAAERRGASAVLLYGEQPPAGSLMSIGIPVIGVSGAFARSALAGIHAHEAVAVALGRARAEVNPRLGRVAAFSSRGLSFGGLVDPDLSAPGVGIATSDPGSSGDGEPAFTTVTGTSVAAAAVAGAAALLADERPALTARDIASLLTGEADADGASVAAGGTGALDVGASAVGEVTASQASIAFGKWTGNRWRATRAIVVHNVSSRPLELRLGTSSTLVTVKPSRLVLRPGRQARVKVTARIAARPPGPILTGTLFVRPHGSPLLRVPWAIGLRPPAASLLGPTTLDRTAFPASDTRPAVLRVAVGRIVTGRAIQIEPAARLDVLLYSANGRFLGVLSRLRDLLPGTYRFGITGRGPSGALLAHGSYQVRLVAWPPLGGEPSRAQIGFRIE